MQETIFTRRYAKLNAEQKKAVDTIDGPVLVIAGPGSGKTELLSLRVANILQQTDLPAASILCLTFTDAGAANMQKRLAGLIGAEAYKVAIHTFHSFGTDVINRYPDYFYKGVRYKPADELTRVGVVEGILKDLPLTNPLSSFSDEHGYTFRKDITARIADLKKGGLTAEQYASIIHSNETYLTLASPIANNFFAGQRISNKILALVPQFIDSLNAPDCETNDIPRLYSSIKETIIDTLKTAYESSIDLNKTKPITEWKNKFLEKDVNGCFIFKAHKDLPKHLALVDVYQTYQQTMHELGLFDFEDMILDVVQATSEHADLKFSLQEKYQYVLIDEFQDTNGVQMRLLELLLDAEVNEGRPNVLAVGDDDQSIFKFQGAKANNILDFKENYRDPEIIVLTENYRSTQPILDLIRNVIIKGEDRLENRVEAINKQLVASNKTLTGGEIAEKIFETEFHEFIWVAEEIKKRMDNGEDLNEIAVIAPKHKFLEEISRYLDYFGVPISYERKKNIFEQKHIMKLINMMRFVSYTNEIGKVDADYLLPEILAYDFFGIPRLEIWKISLEASRKDENGNKKLWLEIMLEHENPKIKQIAEFFINLSVEALQWTGEEIIDVLTGVKSLEIETPYTCPFKAFYFGADVFEEKRDEYMDHLTALQAFISAVRNFKGGTETLSIKDLVDFVDLHERHNLKLSYQTAFNNSENAVQLLSSHKAKGLEFETVYSVSCSDSIWFSKGGSDNITFPPNIPLSADPNNHDDHLRLFYVTLSRAKRNLFITHHQYKDNGDGSNKLRFLEEEEVQEKLGKISKEELLAKHNLLVNEKGLKDFYELKFNSKKYSYHNDNENAYLKKLLENYQLSVTHLNKFLNIKDAGPIAFLEDSLLRFPHRQTISLAYGNAVHETMEKLHREFAKTASLPSLAKLLEIFAYCLSKQRLNKHDFDKLIEKGAEQLPIYYQKRLESFDAKDKVELSFKNENVIVEGAKLNGKLDKVKIVDTHEMLVFDLKTGKAFNKWDNSWKSNNYKDQLVFYKLLVENSRNYSQYKVNEGVIEFFEAQEGEIVLLHYSISPQEVENMKKLVSVVYNKIINLDFPDTSRYTTDSQGNVTDAGVRAFRQDLLDGNI